MNDVRVSQPSVQPAECCGQLYHHHHHHHSSATPPESSHKLLPLIALLVCDCGSSASLPNCSVVAARLPNQQWNQEAAAAPGNLPRDGQTPTNDGNNRNHATAYRRVRTAVLNLIELNHFKELTHLSLTFHSVSEEKVQQYLSGRLEQWKVYACSLENEIGIIDGHRKQWIDVHSELNRRCELLLDERVRIQNQMQSKYEEEKQRLVAQHDNQMQAQKQELCENRASLETQFNRKIESLCNERDLLQQQVEELTNSNSAVLTAERTLRRELNESKRELAERSKELQRLLTSSAQLGDSQKVLEKENESLRGCLALDHAEVVALQARLPKVEESSNQMRQEKEAATRTLEASRKRITELKEALEKSAAEITKGNELIEKLQNALKRESIKAKQLRSECKASGSLMTKIDGLEKRERSLIDREAELNKEVEELKEKLLDAQHVMKGNQTTIESLERQLTDRTIEAVLFSSSSSSVAPARLFSTSSSSSLVAQPSIVTSSAAPSSFVSPLHIPLVTQSVASPQSNVHASVLNQSFQKLAKTCSNPAATTNRFNESQFQPQTVPLPTRLSLTSPDNEQMSYRLPVAAAAGGSSIRCLPPQQREQQQNHKSKDRTSPADLLITNAKSSPSAPAVRPSTPSPLAPTCNSLEAVTASEMSFGRQHQSRREDGEGSNDRYSTTDYVDSLSYSISTLESSGAPHFGCRRRSATPAPTTISEDEDESHNEGEELSLSLSS